MRDSFGIVRFKSNHNRNEGINERKNERKKKQIYNSKNESRSKYKRKSSLSFIDARMKKKKKQPA